MYVNREEIKLGYYGTDIKFDSLSSNQFTNFNRQYKEEMLVRRASTRGTMVLQTLCVSNNKKGFEKPGAMRIAPKTSHINYNVQWILQYHDRVPYDKSSELAGIGQTAGVSPPSVFLVLDDMPFFLFIIFFQITRRTKPSSSSFLTAHSYSQHQHNSAEH